jgi:hypothetical protein
VAHSPESPLQQVHVQILGPAAVSGAIQRRAAGNDVGVERSRADVVRASSAAHASARCPATERRREQAGQGQRLYGALGAVDADHDRPALGSGVDHG